MTAKSLYAYTLQPVIYEVSEEEQRHAQLVIWRSTNKIGMKAWIIMGVIVALSILGILLLKNYSTIFQVKGVPRIIFLEAFLPRTI